MYLFGMGAGTSTVSLSYSQFLADARRYQISTAVFGNSSNGSNTTVTGKLANSKDYSTTVSSDTSALANQLKAAGTRVSYTQPSAGTGTLLLNLLFILAPLLFGIYLFRRSSPRA